jgi:type I restriction enzyme S subunit
MSEWREVELAEVADVQTGPFGSQLKNEQYVTGGTPVVTVEHVKDFRILDFDYPSVTEEDKLRLSKYLLQEGDIVFTRVGSVDLSAYVKKHQNGWMFSSRMLRVRPKSKTLYSRYLGYFFQQNRFREYILAISVGATMPSINTQILSSVPVSFPPLPEQRAIAEVLSSLDDKIDLLHRQNQTLEAMGEALFRQWFVEEAEEDWEEGVLGDILTFNYGKGLPKRKRTGSGFPVYGSSGITDYHSEYLVKGPGVITGRKGTLGVINYSFDSFFPIDTTYYILNSRENSNLLFEYFLLKQLNLGAMNTDSAVPGLNRENAESIEINIPSNYLIREFEALLEPMFEKIKLNLDQIHNLTNTRDTLLPKLMSGEVRVDF